MDSSDINVLIAAGQAEATALQDRAVQGVRALDDLDHTVADAQQKIQQFLEQASQDIQKTLHAIEAVDKDLQAEQAKAEQAIQDCQQQAKQLEPEVQHLVERDSQGTAKLNGQTDETLKALEKAMAACREHFDRVTGQVRQELALLEKQQAAATGAVTAFNDAAQAGRTDLDTKVKSVMGEYDSLEAAIGGQVRDLEQVYQAVSTKMDADLTNLETLIDGCIKTSQASVEQGVHEASQIVQQAATRLGVELDQLEGAIGQVGDAAFNAHTQYADNVENSVIPGVKAVSGSLYKAAYATQLVDGSLQN